MNTPCALFLTFLLLNLSPCWAEETPGPSSATSEIKWSPPRTEERKKEREEMVKEQLVTWGRNVKDPAVLDAMRNVPRHWFVPYKAQSLAYADRPLGIGYAQTISQPFIVALMTQALELKAGDAVLEIGTGSGYQAAILSELTHRVYTIEIVEELAKKTADLLKERKYSVIRTKHADGYFGWEEHGPFDAIIVTCAASHIPSLLIKQLKPGGRMCIPVGGPFATQRLMLLTKQEDGTTRSKNLELVRFVPMTGAIEGE